MVRGLSPGLERQNQAPRSGHMKFTWHVPETKNARRSRRGLGLRLSLQAYAMLECFALGRNLNLPLGALLGYPTSCWQLAASWLWICSCYPRRKRQSYRSIVAPPATPTSQNPQTCTLLCEVVAVCWLVIAQCPCS